MRTLGIAEAQFVEILELGAPDRLRELVRRQVADIDATGIDDICSVLTWTAGE